MCSLDLKLSLRVIKSFWQPAASIWQSSNFDTFCHHHHGMICWVITVHTQCYWRIIPCFLHLGSLTSGIWNKTLLFLISGGTPWHSAEVLVGVMFIALQTSKQYPGHGGGKNYHLSPTRIYPDCSGYSQLLYCLSFISKLVVCKLMYVSCYQLQKQNSSIGWVRQRLLVHFWLYSQHHSYLI
jgi:hypothetical protein